MTEDRRTVTQRWVPIAASTAIGAALGWLVESTLAWITIGAIIGLGVATMIVVYGMRSLVAAPIGLGAGIGAYLGGTIVGVLCEPAGCPAFEAAAATTTGLGALVGIGLVVALAARSFDEHQDAVRRGAPPPTSACSTEDRPKDSDGGEEQ